MLERYATLVTLDKILRYRRYLALRYGGTAVEVKRVSGRRHPCGKLAALVCKTARGNSESG